MQREIYAGLALGAILGAIGFTRITIWSVLSPETYGPHWPAIALTVGLSLIGIVLLGLSRRVCASTGVTAVRLRSGDILGAIRRHTG